MNCSIMDYMSEGVIPDVTSRAESYIIKCLDYTTVLYIVSGIDNILEGEYRCVKSKQMKAAIEYCKYLGIEIGDTNCSFESIDDAIEWCIEIADNCLEDQEYISLCEKIQEAFKSVSPNYLTKSEKNKLGIISFEDS
jgi:hypothetical protein